MCALSQTWQEHRRAATHSVHAGFHEASMGAFSQRSEEEHASVRKNISRVDVICARPGRQNVDAQFYCGFGSPSVLSGLIGITIALIFRARDATGGFGEPKCVSLSPQRW